MSVQYCPNCSCEFSKRQTTSDNYKHIAKCLADAAGKQGCEITVNSFVHRKTPERPAVVVSRPSWETLEPGVDMPDFATECRFNLCLDQVRQLHDARAAQTQQRSVLDVIPEPRHAVTQPANWKVDMRSSIADMNAALTRSILSRWEKHPPTW